ncbi:MAG TPA: hypothetical protein VFZ76_16750 [Anaerolineales bacterium]
MTVGQPDAALKAVYWGLDVAWDLYVGTGTILFSLCMFGRRGLGASSFLLGRQQRRSSPSLVGSAGPD